MASEGIPLVVEKVVVLLAGVNFWPIPARLLLSHIPHSAGLQRAKGQVIGTSQDLCMSRKNCSYPICCAVTTIGKRHLAATLFDQPTKALKRQLPVAILGIGEIDVGSDPVLSLFDPPELQKYGPPAVSLFNTGGQGGYIALSLFDQQKALKNERYSRRPLFSNRLN
jgi:hypothetical protein